MATFELGDLVWAVNKDSKYWPGKISTEESSKKWKKSNLISVQFFRGQGRGHKPQWVSEVVSFECGSTSPKFEDLSLKVAFKRAKAALAKTTGKAKVHLNRSNTDNMTPVYSRRKSKRALKPKKQYYENIDDEIQFRVFSEKKKGRAIKLDEDEYHPDKDEDDIGDDEDKENNDNTWKPKNDKENYKPDYQYVRKGPAKQRKPLAALERLAPMPKEELSEYELIQVKRREEQRAMLESMKLASADLTKVLMPKKQNKENCHRRLSMPVPFKRYSTRRQPPRTRSGRNSTGTFSVEKRPIDQDDNDDEDEEGMEPYPKRHRRSVPSMWLKNPNIDFKKPEDITDIMLASVCDYFGEKIYDKIRGSSCHQCRQKTLDMKTICRSGECLGVRGQFCGVCLKLRYGQDARKALKDPEWKCPPCEGKCNCSICRTRIGLAPTGCIAPVATACGFNSAMDYLEAQEKDGTSFVNKNFIVDDD